MAESWRRLWKSYERFMERQGFYVVLGICVLVIVASAFFTFKTRDALENPTLTDAQEEAAESAAQNAQTLAEALIASRSAEEALVLPTAAPLSFARPVEGYAARTFSVDQPVYFTVSRAWQTHAAVDIECEYGARVAACADGTVRSVERDATYGLCVRIAHADGYESLYAGLADATYVRAGDPVRKGEVIAHAGDGVLFEEGPHLHWAVYLDGSPIDPLPLALRD